jgi:hypothetical protein
VAKQAVRLMGDARFRNTVVGFHDQWLELAELMSAEKDAKLFPAWNEALRAAMAEETQRFITSVMTEGDGKLQTLLTARYSFLTGPLYDIYGVAKPAAATTWQKVDLNPAQRAGILTQPGLMAGLAKPDKTNFILRGKLLREAVLCYEVPPPPPGVDNEPAGIPATADARTRSAMHRQKPECAVCHGVFDELGFSFEMFDPIGRFRAGVDSHGEITGTQGLNGRVANAVELIDKMSSSAEVRDCFAKQWLRFALGQEDSGEHQPSLDGAIKTFNEGGGKISDLLVALARSDAFRYQKVRP